MPFYNLKIYNGRKKPIDVVNILVAKGWIKVPSTTDFIKYSDVISLIVGATIRKKSM